MPDTDSFVLTSVAEEGLDARTEAAGMDSYSPTVFAMLAVIGASLECAGFLMFLFMLNPVCIGMLPACGVYAVGRDKTAEQAILTSAMGWIGLATFASIGIEVAIHHWRQRHRPS